MPTRFEWPSRTTTGSVKDRVSPFSGICHTWKGEKGKTVSRRASPLLPSCRPFQPCPSLAGKKQLQPRWGRLFTWLAMLAVSSPAVFTASLLIPANGKSPLVLAEVRAARVSPAGPARSQQAARLVRNPAAARVPLRPGKSCQEEE